MAAVTVPVSVAIATLERSQFLARFLDALLKGEVLPTEIIIIDQGQDAETVSLIQRFQSAKIPLIYHRQAIRGLSHSRNASIACASSPLIAFSDDDCVPHMGWLKKIAQSFSDHPGIAAVTGRVLPYGPESSDTYTISTRTDLKPHVFFGKSLPWQAGTGGNLAVRKEWLDKVGGFDVRLGAGSPGLAGEDAEFVYRLLVEGASIHYEPDMIIYHERQGLERRLATRYSYAYGIGALCGLTLRRADPYAFYILAIWFVYLMKLGARSLWMKNWQKIDEHHRSLRGCVGGLRYGFGLDPRLSERMEH